MSGVRLVARPSETPDYSNQSRFHSAECHKFCGSAKPCRHFPNKPLTLNTRCTHPPQVMSKRSCTLQSVSPTESALGRKVPIRCREPQRIVAQRILKKKTRNFPRSSKSPRSQRISRMQRPSQKGCEGNSRYLAASMAIRSSRMRGHADSSISSTVRKPSASP